MNYKHGFKHTRFYRIYGGIVARTSNKKLPYFSSYGGRGIKCLWKSFEEFRDDMYESYQFHIKEFGEKNTSINRVDNNGYYSKENCRWATRKMQGRNMRNNKNFYIDGIKYCIAELSEIYKIPYKIVHQRIFRNKWNAEKAVKTPVRKFTFSSLK